MSSAYTTISSIETFYNSILDGDISENVYPSTLPPNRPDDWKDMAVISCDNGIKNKGAVNDMLRFGCMQNQWLMGRRMLP